MTGAPHTGRPLRVGLLGCADVALRRMLPAMVAHPEIEVTVIGSRDAARAKASADRFGGRPVTGYEDVVAADDVDAVYAPVPASLHATWVEAALRAGKHVLAEKPLTTDLASTRRLLDLARDRGLALVENVMFVHHTQHRAVRELLDSAVIGELRALHAVFTIPQPPPQDIRHRPDLGGGALWDVGVYPLRAALHFLGPALTVAGAVLSRGAGHQVDTAGAVVLRTPQGITAQLSFGMAHAYRSSYELHGSEGRIIVERAYTPPSDHVPLVRLESAAGARTLRLAPDDQVTATLTAFVAAIRARAQPDPAVLRLAQLLEQVRHFAPSTTAARG
ncbi:Gfo/Idh/MocA family protein [Streptomyces cellulosae]